MRLLNDLCLVKLAPKREDRATPAGIILEPAIAPPVCYGKVVSVGPKVNDVRPEDFVVFGPSDGEALDGYFATPHVLIREPQISGVLYREA